MKQKTKQTFIHRFGMNRGGIMLKHYYDERIDNDLMATPHYMWSMRYVWFEYKKNHNRHSASVGWANRHIDNGVFSEGYGWYSFVQTGPQGLYSPYITALIKCRGRNEAYKIASRRSAEDYTIPPKDLEIMQARYNLLGGLT